MGVCTSREIHDAVEVRVVSEPPKLLKRESDMNLVVEQFQQHRWHTLDESEFERERLMVVCAPSVSAEQPGRLFIYDVDYQSKCYGQRVSELILPRNGDEFLYSCWARCAATSAEVNSTPRHYLILPCFNTSRIYVVGIDESQQMRVSKCLDLQELSARDVSFPLDCFSCPDRGTPLFVSMLGDKHGSAKGTLIKMDRKLFSLNPQRVDEEGELKGTAGYGGAFAIRPRQNLLISAEWGSPRHIQLGPQLDYENHDGLYGSALNVWTIEPRALQQRLPLEEVDGQMPLCIRFVHNPELVHAFCCTKNGGLFHLHKNSRTEQFAARKAFQFPTAHVSGWTREEVPAIPTDLVISMDDAFLYATAWLQGFVHQFNIADPFNIFLGGVIHKEFGNFSPVRRCLRGLSFEGGPARLQLSLDGRRLYVGNSWLRGWDEAVYPRLREQGGLIALIHVNVHSAGALTLDENFAIDLSERRDDDPPFVPRCLNFLNGDCTSDSFL
ncbi:putative selenium-binding protein [Aphelenchoides fujianensis]|nr:putative selenium-binding protein [Aphelenchoides fujianensis]